MKFKLWFLEILIVYLITMPIQAKQKLVFSTFFPSPLVQVSGKIIQTAYQRIGIEVKIKNFPGERALAMSNAGKVDGELFRRKQVSEHYLNLVLVPVSIFKPEIVVFTKTHEFSVQGWESLKRYRIGVERGFKMVEQNTKGMRVYSSTTIKELFQMLDAGRVDIVPQVRMDGLNILKQLNITDIKVLTPPLHTGEVFHFLHKKHQDLVPRITKVLESMEKEGEIQQIKNQIIAELKNAS